MSKPQGGLGRGLGSLIPQMTPPHASSAPASVAAPEATVNETIEVAAEGSLRIREIAPSQIVANPFQPRRHFAPADLEDLVSSIREHGLLQPLVVTEKGDGTYELIAGERRLRASRLVGLEKIPVIIREADDRQKLELAIIENVQRADLNAVEEALAYRALMQDFGLTQEAMAQRVGKSRPQIANTLRLLDLSPDILEALKEGKITRSAARTLLAEDNAERRQELFTRMQEGGVTVREAEQTVRTHTRKPRAAADPNMAAIERELREKIGTKVEIKMTTNASGTVIIHFYSKDDLKALIEHLT